MAHIVVDSVDDPRLVPYRNIRQRDPKSGVNSDTGFRPFIAEGRMVVERLLASRYHCESLVVQHSLNDDLVKTALAKNSDTTIFYLDSRVISELVGYDFHRGVLACGLAPPLPRFDQLSDEWLISTDRMPTLLVCGVNNPENIGGLMRTAAAMGISRLGIASDVASPFSRRALRVSMAAALTLDIFMLVDYPSEVAQLSSRYGYRTIATTLAEGAADLSEFCRDLKQASGDARSHRLALIMGSESEGLTDAVLAASTDRVTIPMSFGADSLNVNVAAAIFLYELTKIFSEQTASEPALAENKPSLQ